MWKKWTHSWALNLSINHKTNYNFNKLPHITKSNVDEDNWEISIRTHFKHYRNAHKTDFAHANLFNYFIIDLWCTTIFFERRWWYKSRICITSIFERRSEAYLATLNDSRLYHYFIRKCYKFYAKKATSGCVSMDARIVTEKNIYCPHFISIELKRLPTTPGHFLSAD